MAGSVFLGKLKKNIKIPPFLTFEPQAKFKIVYEKVFKAVSLQLVLLCEIMSMGHIETMKAYIGLYMHID